MSRLDPRKKKTALKMRLERKTCAEIAKKLHMTPRTVHNLEHGWTDKKGVHHPGWREELEKAWAEEERAVIESGLALKIERIKALKTLGADAIELFREQFPNIVMKNASDSKAILSEIRELIRLLAQETGDLNSGRGGTVVAIKNEVSVEEAREAYAEMQAMVIDEIEPPEEAHYDDERPDQD